VFLLATNYVSNFDAAFSRGGRFDMILQVMPPTAEAKLTFPDWADPLKTALESISDRKKGDALSCLADLTFLETQQLVFELGQSVEDVFEVFKSARDHGTMNRNNGDKTWKLTCKEEEVHIRLPAVSPAA